MKNRKTYVIFLFILFLYFSYLLQENYLIYNTKDNKTILFGREDKNYTNIKPFLSNNNPLEYVWNHTWGGDKEDYGEGIVIDSFDNIYVAGNTYSFGTGGKRTCILKYDKSGNYKWDKTIDGDFTCYAMALGSLDNIFLAGVSIIHGPGGGANFGLIKYDSSGGYQWNRSWDAGANDNAFAIAIDSLNNIYLTGYTDLGTGGCNMSLVKLNNSGMHQWNCTWGGIEYDTGLGVVIDSSDNIYVTGYTHSFGAGLEDMFLVKYNSSGVQQWNCTWGGIYSDTGHGVAIDSSHNIYITGNTRSYGAGKTDMYLVKFSNSGIQLWNRTWGEFDYDNAYGIAIDSSDDIYIGGYTHSFGAGQDDMCLVKYNSSGVQQWNRTWGGNDYDFCKALGLDSSKNVYLAGSTKSFGIGDYDICLIKYSIEPQITINSPNHNEFFKNDAPNFNISISVLEGDLNTTWYSLDGGIINITFSELIGTIDQTEWNKKGDGTITIQLYANDTTSNDGYAEMIVRKDTTAPISSISFVPHSGTNIVNISTLFTLTSDDGIGSGVSKINYKINNSDFIEYNEPFNLSGYEFGDYNISYSAIDTVGNIEEINTLLVKIVDIGIIPGYDLVVLFSIIGLISVILIKYRYKVYN